MKKSSLIIGLFIIVIIISSRVLSERNQPTSNIPGYTQVPTSSSIKTVTSSSKPLVTNTPSVVTFSLKVPFTPQAPTGNWDKEHNEACEEASALMAAAYFNGDTRSKIPTAEVEKELTRLFEWERANFGHSLDITTAENAEML